MFCDYQINLGNTINLISSLEGWGGGDGGGGDIQYFWEGGRTLYGRTWHFLGRLDNLLETVLYYLTLIRL